MLFTHYINQVVEVQIEQVEDQIKSLQKILSNLQEQKQALLSVEQQCESGINQLELAYQSVRAICPEMNDTFKNRVLAIFDESSQLNAAKDSDSVTPPKEPDPVNPNDNAETIEETSEVSEVITTIDVQSTDVQATSDPQSKLTYDELYAIDTQILIKIAETLGVTIEGNKTRKKLATALTGKVFPFDYQNALKTQKGGKLTTVK